VFHSHTFFEFFVILFLWFVFQKYLNFSLDDPSSLSTAEKSLQQLIGKLGAGIAIMEKFSLYDAGHIHQKASESSASSSNPRYLLNFKLEHHSTCSNLRQYNVGVIGIEPHALVQAVERHLIVHDCGRIQRDEFDEGSEDLLQARNEV
jgi:hypothetical protein